MNSTEVIAIGDIARAILRKEKTYVFPHKEEAVLLPQLKEKNSPCDKGRMNVALSEAVKIYNIYQKKHESQKKQPV